MKRDLFTPQLRELRAMNAGYKKIHVGTRRRPRLHLVFNTIRGHVVITNRITGTTAREDDAAARAVLLAEVGPWLKFVDLRLRWELAPRGPRRGAAGRALLAHLKAMQAMGLSAVEARP